jgi:uncharacterized protein YyaL (SSP411 family)
VDAFHRLNPPNAVLVTVPETGPDPGSLALMPSLRGKTAIDGRATAYVCRFGSCARPTSDPGTLREQILEGWVL